MGNIEARDGCRVLGFRSRGTLQARSGWSVRQSLTRQTPEGGEV